MALMPCIKQGCGPESRWPVAKIISIVNQKGGVGILHELNPEEMEEAFQQHLTQRNKGKTA